jgi:hypothetical protein
MDIRLESTEGLGRLAEIYINGQSYFVCDGISTPSRRVTPGVLEGVAFQYVTEAGFDWSEAVRGNPSEKRQLEHVRKWAYVGLGRVVAIMPVLIDFGVLTMEDANWTNDESLVGAYVRIPIDRLEIVWASETDWPEDAR